MPASGEEPRLSAHTLPRESTSHVCTRRKELQIVGLLELTSPENSMTQMLDVPKVKRQMLQAIVDRTVRRLMVMTATLARKPRCTRPSRHVVDERLSARPRRRRQMVVGRQSCRSARCEPSLQPFPLRRDRGLGLSEPTPLHANCALSRPAPCRSTTATPTNASPQLVTCVAPHLTFHTARAYRASETFAMWGLRLFWSM